MMMTFKRKRPDADGMGLLCTLHWPLAILRDPETPDREVGRALLETYLEAVHPQGAPTREPVPALLTDDDLLELTGFRANTAVK
jgi:hypothetical protein